MGDAQKHNTQIFEHNPADPIIEEMQTLPRHLGTKCSRVQCVKRREKWTKIPPVQAGFKSTGKKAKLTHVYAKTKSWTAVSLSSSILSVTSSLA